MAVQVVTAALSEHVLGDGWVAVGPIAMVDRSIVSVNPFSPVRVRVVEAVPPAATGPIGLGEALMVKSTTWTLTVALWLEYPGDDPVTVTT